MGAKAISLPEIPPFNFSRNLPFLSDKGSLGFKIAGQIPTAAAQALISKDHAFPTSDDLDLVDAKVTASTAQPIVFSRSGSDKISFSASGGAFGGFGVYRKPATLLKKLPADQFVMPALDFAAEDGQLFSCLRWGFEAQAKGNGSMALGAVGSATLAVEAGAEGLFAVVRRLSNTLPARKVVQETAESWVMPRQVRSARDLQPGTWLLAEVMGRVGATLGAQVGYDLTWVREVALGTLKGDVGLRVQLGAGVNVGFQASGKCAVVLSRETDDAVLRLRVLRLKSKQLDIAADASVGVQAIDTLIGNMDVDDFVKAVFGLHGEQLLRDVAVVEKWTDPKTKITDLLAAEGVAGAESLIAAMAGVDVKVLQTSFDAVHDRVVGLINKWRDLPHSVSTTLLRFLDQKLPMDKVREIATLLATSDSDKVKAFLNEKLSDVAFFSSPEGRLLESIAGGPLLKLLNKTDVPDIAKAILGILDNGNLQSALETFRDFAETRLHIKNILDVATATDFKGLDELLKNKVAAFLGQTSIPFKDIEKARETINRVLKLRHEYFEKALAALHKKYTFELTQTFQRSTTDQALLDATFDFSDSSHAAQVADMLAKALSGDFDPLFTQITPGVKLGLGELTHGVKRHSHTDVTLPFLRFSSDHDNRSLASAKVQDVDGRVIGYTLDSSDAVADNHRSSLLSLSLAMTARGIGSPAVRVFQNKLEMSYSLVATRRNLTRGELENFVQPFADRYFGKTIKNLDAWTDFIDSRTEEEIPQTPGSLGNALMNLQVTLDPEAANQAGAAWLSLPANKKDPKYAEISFALQRTLRQTISQIFFRNGDSYHDLGVARPLMAYASIPPIVDPGFSAFPYFDSFASGKVRTLLDRKETLALMQGQLRRALAFIGGDSDKQFYQVKDAKTILSSVSENDPRLKALLFVEAEIVKHAFQAAVSIAKFSQAAGKDKPSDAIKALTEFGSKLTEALNKDLVSVYVGNSVRALGIELYLAASAAIGGPGDAKRSAMLSLEFMKPGAPFKEDLIRTQGHIDAEQIAVAERVATL